MNLKQILKKENIAIFSFVTLVIILFTLAAYITNYQPKTGIDDANITFVYAKNIANGHGFVYNAGGERVEGASSMLWALLTSLAFKFFSSPQFIILVFNILILSISITYLVKFLLYSFKSRYLGLIASGILLTWIFAVPNFTVWGTITLMEFGLYSSIIMLLITSLLRSSYKMPIDRFIFTFSLFLIGLVRPESLLWTPVFIALYFMMQLHNSKNFKSAIKFTLLPATVGISTIIGLILFRLSYFGYPFPNTYYAKVSPNLMYNLSEGYHYLRQFIESNNIAFFLLGLSGILGLYLSIKAIANIVRRKTFLTLNELNTFIVVAIVGVGTFIPIYNGGDHFNQFRFFQPIWPLLILVGISTCNLIGFDTAKLRLNKTSLMLFILSAAFFLFYSSNNIQWHKYNSQQPITISEQFQVGVDQGKEMHQMFEPLQKLPSIGVLAAGGLKLNYNGTVIDLLGLNNVEMAHATGEKSGFKNHASFNKEVFYKQQPDFFVFFRMQSFDIPSFLINRPKTDFSYQILQGIYDEEKFKEIYSPAVVYNADQDFYLFAFFKNEFLNSLPKDKYEVKISPRETNNE